MGGGTRSGEAPGRRLHAAAGVGTGQASHRLDAQLCPLSAAAVQVVSAWTGVPVERMSEDDRDRLLTLADALKVGAP